MKKKYVLFTPLLVFSIALNACASESKRIEEVSFDEQTFGDYDGYYRHDISEYNLTEYPQCGVFGAYTDPSRLPTPSMGTVNVLVVPVYFEDSDTFSKEDLKVLNKVYNADSKDTGWESLHSFYYKSSYGKLDFEATVVEPYNVGIKTAAFRNWENYSPTGKLAYKITKWLIDDKGMNLKKFDSNDDGYIDCLQMIYKYNEKTGDGDTFWAYTTMASASAAASATSNKKLPYKPEIYFWSRYSMIENDYYDINIDAHTLTHETGHALGLNDYYDYDRNKGDAPAGMCDMMDLNIGDHSAFSKMLLGWTSPYYVDGSKNEVTITLNSFAETGDFILLKDNWNGTPYDEYLTLSYFTPDLNNKQDSEMGYPEWQWDRGEYGVGGLYKKAGLALHHVDNRQIAYRQNYFGYARDINDLKYSYSTAHSNTQSQSVNVEETVEQLNWVTGSPYKQFALIAADKSNTLNENYAFWYLGNQNFLFSTPEYGGGASSFNIADYSHLFAEETKFDDGEDIAWSFEILEQNDDNITVKLTKNA